MNESAATHHPEKLTWLQCVILILSVYVLAAVFVQTVFKLSPETNLLLDCIDSLICFVFLYDFFVHLYKAPSKKAFLKWGWLDFVSSIPMLGIFRWARVARVVRILRLLRAFRSSRILIAHLFQHRASSTFATVGSISVILVIFSSIAILHVETESGSNIKTPADALWWACTTVTTVGYGDKYPVTPEGRVVAIVLMIAGVGLFATFTAYISSFFLESAQKRNEVDIKELIREVKLLREKIDSRDRLTDERSPEQDKLPI
ncbi:MAG: ion transporter [Pedosphaera sp.]|nr:ion transporter [Pedosphaera sp.]